jgi:hypothetical protein
MSRGNESPLNKHAKRKPAKQPPAAESRKGAKAPAHGPVTRKA